MLEILMLSQVRHELMLLEILTGIIVALMAVVSTAQVQIWVVRTSIVASTWINLFACVYMPEWRTFTQEMSSTG